MKAWLIDVYRKEKAIVLWLKTRNKNMKKEIPFIASIYVDIKSKDFLDRKKIKYEVFEKFDYKKNLKKVCKIKIYELNKFESIVRFIEKATKHKAILYNADIAPEQQFLFSNNLRAGALIQIKEQSITSINNDSEIQLKKSNIDLTIGKEITEIKFNKLKITGSEQKIMKKFADEFQKQDPDIIVIKNAFSNLPYLIEKLEKYKIDCKFHRWDSTPIKHKGGKSFFSYGRVIYRDFAIRLRGRFLVDTSSIIGGDCDVEGILELCKLTGAQFQHIASRSFGAAFQFSLIRLIYQKGYLIPFKEKPVDVPLSMFHLLKGDRGGHTFDAKIGFHKNVAEIDFTSMFPFIIYNKNISAETIHSKSPPIEKVPGIPITISHAQKGIVPLAIKPILDKRIEYKKNPTTLNIKRAFALKQVLVTAYGYLRFREFKLGIATSHMAICAYAREIIIQAARLAEEKGFLVIHGIIDSLYIKKANINESEVREFCKELEQLVGIPVSFEGIFKWIVFLPSVNDPYRPLPATYYGTFKNNEIKARGIEVRQKRAPLLIKVFQKEVLEAMAKCNSKKEILKRLKDFCNLIKNMDINKSPKGWLIHPIRVSTTNYKKNIPQKKIIDKLKRKKIKVLPGQKIEYIMQINKKVVLPEEYNNKADVKYYKALLVRSLFVLLQPFKITKEKIIELANFESQTKLTDFYQVKHLYIPLYKNYKTNKGLSEKRIKLRLEKNNWIVWRGSLFNILKRTEIYPNVRRKYNLLINLINKIHPGTLDCLQYLCQQSGMPDFICFRDNKFKFVECKFKHEQLSKTQKLCIKKLQKLGFTVEVHKLVGHETKTRLAQINLHTNQKKIIARQMTLATYKNTVVV